jgi:membrane protein
VSLTSIRLREAWNWGGLSAKQLATRTWGAMGQHDTLNQAAVVAFYAMLGLVPFLGLILALALGTASGVAEQITTLSRTFLPPQARDLLLQQIDKIRTSPPVGVLSFSFVVLLWSSSSLFVAIMDATNASYSVRDSRPWWKRRLMAIVLALVESVLLVGAATLIVLWPALLDWFHLGSWSPAATVVQWLVVIIVLLASFATAYYFGPDVEQEWEWITPGSALGVLVLILASLGFRFYLHYGSTYSETYGALAGVVLMMLWLYLAALALLVGAEINCVIEFVAPHGRAPGQKEEPQGLP